MSTPTGTAQFDLQAPLLDDDRRRVGQSMDSRPGVIARADGNATTRTESRARRPRADVVVDETLSPDAHTSLRTLDIRARAAGTQPGQPPTQHRSPAIKTRRDRINGRRHRIYAPLCGKSHSPARATDRSHAINDGFARISCRSPRISGRSPRTSQRSPRTSHRSPQTSRRSRDTKQDCRDSNPTRLFSTASTRFTRSFHSPEIVRDPCTTTSKTRIAAFGRASTRTILASAASTGPNHGSTCSEPTPSRTPSTPRPVSLTSIGLAV